MTNTDKPKVTKEELLEKAKKPSAGSPKKK